MPDLLEKTGKIIFLRAHDLGTGYGPPNDFLDVEAVFILDSLSEAHLASSFAMITIFLLGRRCSVCCAKLSPIISRSSSTI